MKTNLIIFAVLILCIAFYACNVTPGTTTPPPVEPVTDGALMLTSTSGGNEWTKYYVRDFFSIWRIGNLNNYSDNKLVLILSQNGNDIRDIRSTTDYGQSWFGSFSSSEILLDHAIVPGSGTNGGENFVTGASGQLIQSQDEGNSWTASQQSSTTLRAIDFIKKSNEQNIGIIIPSSSTEQVLIYQNNSWGMTGPIDTKNNENLEDVKFIDDSTAIVCGHTGFVARTTDTGNSWEIDYPVTEHIKSIDYYGGILIAGASDGSIIRSTDKGLTWNTISTGLVTLNGVYAHSTSFWAFGTGAIAKSTDQGLTWTIVYEDKFDRFYDMYISISGEVYIVGGRYVYN